MIAFFVILVVLMVLVFAAGQWNSGSRRRVIYDREVVVERQPDVVERGPGVVEEEILDRPHPVARSRRVLRRRGY